MKKILDALRDFSPIDVKPSVFKVFKSTTGFTHYSEVELTTSLALSIRTYNSRLTFYRYKEEEKLV